MRGLLGFLAFLVIAVGLMAYAGIHLLLPAVVTAGVRGSAAFMGEPVSVNVATSVEGVLLHGWIDDVSIDAAGLRWPLMTADRAQVTLTDVGLTGQSFATIDGTVEGVTLETPSGASVSVASLRLTGTEAAIQGIGMVSAATLETALQAALHSVATAQITLLPGGIRLDIAGEVISAQLLLDGGGIVLDAGRLGRLAIMRSPSDGTWAITSVAVTAAGAQVTLLILPTALGIGR